MLLTQDGERRSCFLSAFRLEKRSNVNPYGMYDRGYGGCLKQVVKLTFYSRSTTACYRCLSYASMNARHVLMGIRPALSFGHNLSRPIEAGTNNEDKRDPRATLIDHSLPGLCAALPCLSISRNTLFRILPLGSCNSKSANTRAPEPEEPYFRDVFKKLDATCQLLVSG